MILDFMSVSKQRTPSIKQNFMIHIIKLRRTELTYCPVSTIYIIVMLSPSRIAFRDKLTDRANLTTILKFAHFGSLLHFSFAEYLSTDSITVIPSFHSVCVMLIKYPLSSYAICEPQLHLSSDSIK